MPETHIVTVLARFEMLEGKEIQAFAVFQRMADEVKANEPGCLMYAITRGQVNPREVYVYEMYKNQEALNAHRKTEHMTDFRSASEGLLDRGSFNVELLDEVAGFVREPVDNMKGQM